MAAGTLYTWKDNFRAHKILIAAKYSQFKLKVCCDAPDFVFGVTNSSQSFLEKFPLGKVPAFETSDGQVITESNAIAFYVSNDQLRGKNLLEQAQVVQFLSFADCEILPPACTWVFPCLGAIQYNKQATERAKEDVKKILSYLNTHLLSKTYLVGERISLADIAVFTALLPLYKLVLEPAFRAPYANVNRWFDTLAHQPEFQAVLGEVQLCQKMAQFDANLYAEIQGKAGKGAAATKKTEKKEAKPKEEPKPKAAPEPEDDLEPALAEPPKKDPFEVFPKGTFNMDDFKRCYSNESETVSVPYFWEKFDKEHYSIWYSEYKYPDELTQVFMSCNLISGMFQRLDKMRKHAFASVILFGEDNNSSISGIWVWRGHELAFKLSEDWQVDYESYDWKKLDADAPETKKLVDEYFKWDGDFGGKKFNQGKIFK
ncbi:elongation factor 1-gamma [Rhipicephalus sanguineus]|uniref:elongation factor 1-gamma n=1 Tax=Rhipicephalus sanguineus TaxID=34632 RepID=UPI0018932366|nr:elongation factor 1-gamma [Rhipicephalus sanguineus]